MISDEIKQNISSLNNDDLIDLLVNGEGYREDALSHAQNEVIRRNLSVTLDQKRNEKRNIEKEIIEFTKGNTEGRYQSLYVSVLSLSIGIIAAFVLYRNFEIMGAEVFSIADARFASYERPYFNLMLLIFNVFTAIGGVLYGIVGLFKYYNHR